MNFYACSGGFILQTEDPSCYLSKSSVIDFDNPDVSALAEMLYDKSSGRIDFVKNAYEYVRDTFPHSADIGAEDIPCSASEVLRAGHGICFAKSHLLAALLRCRDVPAGFCYQRLVLDDEEPSVLIYHGLNGVYIEEMQKWIRLDARGNKPGVHAEFSLDAEMPAFRVRPELGEADMPVVFVNPDCRILEKITAHRNRKELFTDLPTELSWKMQ